MCRSKSNSSSNVTKSSSSSSSSSNSLGSATPTPPSRGPQTSDHAHVKYSTNSPDPQQGDSSTQVSSAPELARQSSRSSADRTIQTGHPFRKRVRSFSSTSSSAIIPRKPATALALRASVAFALISACAGWVVSGGIIARLAHLFRAASGPLFLGTWTGQVRIPADTDSKRVIRVCCVNRSIKLSRVCLHRPYVPFDSTAWSRHIICMMHTKQ